ncbi:MAG: extracellular solute-binding protein [Bacteroidia bacterium]|nr:extracellular solute-binding protein [Bacteroidia bacterium]
MRISLRSALNFFVVVALTLSCKNPQTKGQPDNMELSVFHAGSLSVPMKNLAAAFEKENPGLKVQLEAAGSLACVRKITELNQICDVLALADYSLIDDLIIPKYAQWNILFATNELCIAYNDKSRKANLINAGNWFDILMDPEIRYGRSDPNADPCGYRTVLAVKLADRYYPGGREWQKLLEKDKRFIRGKETDLNALLESQTIDYMFNFRSVAVQHGFKFLRLPDSINLSNPNLDPWYSTVKVDVRGTGPGTIVTQKGASIVYGMTIPTNAPNPKLAEKFIRFITDPGKGRLIIEQSGQTALDPKYSKNGRRDR